jgi:hypothetical protein
MLLNFTDYAKRVNLSRPRVSQLVAKGLPTVGGKIDPDTADKWIAANLDPERRERDRSWRGGVVNEPAPVRVETTEARRQKMQADAGLAKLKLQERAGSLVPREAAENFVFEEGRKIRDGWIAWIARTAPALAHELQSDPQQTFAALDRLVRDHIREISE